MLLFHHLDLPPLGLFNFLGFASNAAALVIECCGIEVSDFHQISSRRPNAAALGTQCCGIEGSDFQKIFSCNSNAAALGCECCGIGYTDLFSSCCFHSNAVTLNNECRGIEPFFCMPWFFSLLNLFSSYILARTTLQIHKMKKIMKNRKT